MLTVLSFEQVTISCFLMQTSRPVISCLWNWPYI